MITINPVYVGEDAIPRLCAHVTAGYPGYPVTVVADKRTLKAAGESLLEALSRAGVTTHPIILSGEDIHAEESSLARVLTRSPEGQTLFIAAGSGTITDITRYISFRLDMPFISFPTASSVDGFASRGCPLVIEGIKRTYYAQTPEAIFADSRVLAAAPPELTAAGLGDLLGKITSITDWRLGAMIRNESFDEVIAQRATDAVDSCMPAVEAIARREPQGLRTLFNALTETGLCMIEFGDSQPASGAEHHISHVWEMRALQGGTPAALHGAQVGIATVFVAGLYERYRSLSASQVRELFRSRLPLQAAPQEEEIRGHFGPLADAIVAGHRDYLDFPADRQFDLAERVVEKWAEIQTLAEAVPAPQEIRRLLAAVGAPLGPGVPGMERNDAEAGLLGGHYLRSRFTAAKLAHMLGILQDQTARAW